MIGCGLVGQIALRHCVLGCANLMSALHRNKSQSTQGLESKLAPILVTGMHRAGTSWLGKMLVASGEATYISAPLNIRGSRGLMPIDVTKQYLYLNADNEEPYLCAFRRMLSFPYSLSARLETVRTRSDVKHMVLDLARFPQARLMRRRVLLKDPFALLSAPWFAERLGCQVVISVRHPLAVVASAKRLGWGFDFNWLLDQPRIPYQSVTRYRLQMAQAQETPPAVVERVALLWVVLYGTVLEYRSRGLDFHLVRHEDLSCDPIAAYRALYERLGFTLSRRAQARILRATREGNPREQERPDRLRLDSRANLLNWTARLQQEEIQQIREVTGPIAEEFYPEDEWVTEVFMTAAKVSPSS